LIFGLTGGKTGRVCAAAMAVLFLALTVFIASLSPDKFFAELSSQNRVDGIIRALKILDGTSRAEDSCPSVPRSIVALALLGAGHCCADIAFISRADAGEPARDFILPPDTRAGGTVARE
jgi:hypothetical protein